MLFDIGNYRLDVDAERTKAYYSTLDSIGCDCAGCRNYEKALPELAEPIYNFLCQFGIDPRKPIEMSVLYSPDGKKTLYDGFFHVCGRILTGDDPWIRTGAKSRMLNQDYCIEVDSNCSAYLINDCVLVDQEFPHPVVQLHISFALPWVLNEPNPYC